MSSQNPKDFTITEITASLIASREYLRVSSPDSFQDLEMVDFCRQTVAPLNYVYRELKSNRYDFNIDGVNIFARLICGRVRVTFSCKDGHVTFQGDVEGFGLSLSELHLTSWEVAHRMNAVSEKFANQVLEGVR